MSPPLRATGLRVLAFAAVAACASSTRAEEQPATPESPGLPLRLIVRERGPQHPWDAVILNDSDTAVWLAADPRLIWFEVKPPGKTKPQLCRLPEEAFPEQPAGPTRLWLEPGDRAAHRFDPRLYCFAEAGQKLLVPGATVIPHFGWPEKVKQRWKNGRLTREVIDAPPHVAHLLDQETAQALETGEAYPTGHAIKVLHGEPFALRSTYSWWAAERLPETEEKPHRFELVVNQGSDAGSEREPTVTLTLRNRAREGRYVYFRRDLVTYEVMGPEGVTLCEPPPEERAPDRHGFLYLRSGESVSVTSRLVETCPRGTFSRAGLYLVHARFEGTVSGAEYELEAFVGRVLSETPATVRIRKGDTEAPPPAMKLLPRSPAPERAATSATARP